MCGRARATTAAAIATAVTLARGHYLLSLVIWNGGALAQQDWSGVRALAAVVALGGIGAALLVRPLRMLSLGAGSASGLGMNVAGMRLAAVALAVWIAASVSAELGLIAFVGLAAPALARILGARGIAGNLAVSPVIGAALLSLCDGLVLGLAAAGGAELPTGAVTGLIGGPLLIWLLPRLRGTTPPGTETAEGPAPRRARPARLLITLAIGALAAALAMLWIGRGPQGWLLLDPQSLAAFLPMRLPRLIAAASAGAALAMAGAILQRLTANPLASRYRSPVSGALRHPRSGQKPWETISRTPPRGEALSYHASTTNRLPQRWAALEYHHQRGPGRGHCHPRRACRP